jgi:outer membrane protein W
VRQSITTECRDSNLKRTFGLSLLLIFGVAAFAPSVSDAGRLGSYLALKGGIYSPSATFNLSNVDVETTFDGDTETGVNGELAIGHYFLPTLALELGVGYFKGKGTLVGENVTATPHKVDFNVVPVIVSAKALIPAGRVDPYGELGIGAYFTDFNMTDNLNTFNGTTTFGIHAGGGLNVNISQNVFVGAEGRYVWADPSFGDEKIKLNETEYALNGFTLNGFTTTLALGFSF